MRGYTRWRCPSVCLFIRSSPVKFVKSFATWQHLVADGGFSYHIRYSCIITKVSTIIHFYDYTHTYRLVKIRRTVMQTCSLLLYSAHAGNNVYEIKRQLSAALRLRTAQVNAGLIQVLTPGLMTDVKLVFSAVVRI